MKITKEGQQCRHCGTPVIKKIPKQRNPNKKYWFKFYLVCPECGTMYMLDDQKIFNPEFQKETPLQAITNAWTIEGKRPSIHKAAKNKLKKEWPTLYNALSMLDEKK